VSGNGPQKTFSGAGDKFICIAFEPRERKKHFITGLQKEKTQRKIITT